MLLCRNKSASTFSGLMVVRFSSVSLPATLKQCPERVLFAGIASSLVVTGAGPHDISCQNLSRHWKRVILRSLMYCSTNWWPHDSISPLSFSLSSSSIQLVTKKNLCAPLWTLPLAANLRLVESAVATLWYRWIMNFNSTT